MSSLRFARSALRARPSVFGMPLQRRGYAEAVSDKLKLSLTLPHQVRLLRVPLGHFQNPERVFADDDMIL